MAHGAASYAAALAGDLASIIELTGTLVAIDSPSDAPEGVAAVCDGHAARGIGSGLHQHGYVEPGKAQRVGDGALVAKIG